MYGSNAMGPCLGSAPFFFLSLLPSFSRVPNRMAPTKPTAVVIEDTLVHYYLLLGKEERERSRQAGPRLTVGLGRADQKSSFPRDSEWDAKREDMFAWHGRVGESSTLEGRERQLVGISFFSLVACHSAKEKKNRRCLLDVVLR